MVREVLCRGNYGCLTIIKYFIRRNIKAVAFLLSLYEPLLLIVHTSSEVVCVQYPNPHYSLFMRAVEWYACSILTLIIHCSYEQWSGMRAVY